MIRHFSLLTAFFVCHFFHANGQVPEPAPFVKVGIFYDQDYTLEQIGFDKLNEDRNYTMGAGFYFSSDCLNKWVIYKPHEWLFKVLKRRRADSAVRFCNLMLANGTFTPDSLAARFPIFNDRPYSSITYLQANANYLDNSKHQMYNISISIGILGSDISREVQTFIHTRMNDGDTHAPRTPRGWGYQISNGGAPSILLGYEQYYLLTTKSIVRLEKNDDSKVKRFGSEWKAGWKVNLGWYNMVSGEISYRFGCIDPRNWTYMTNPLGSSNQKKRSNPKGVGEAYLFGTVRTNLIAYNVLLSGQGGDDPVTIPNKWARHGVLDGTAGFCLSPAFCHRVIIDLKGKINFRSPEFEAPARKPRWHYWGGLELLVTVLK